MGDRPHQARRVELQVTWTANGYLIESPSLPGWRVHAGNPTALVQAMRQAFTEAEVAAYARFHGTEYDLTDLHGDAFDHPTKQPPDQPARPRARHPAEPPPPVQVPRASYRPDAVHRPDCHDPASWTPLPDGRWRSPAGLRYRPTAPVVASVVQRRGLLGLPTIA